MIATMREPVDQFGRKLRELRKARGVTADKLSLAVGGSKTLVGKWERESRAVTAEVLRKIADALRLSPAEHRDLSRLAALRRVPDDFREELAPAPDPDANLLQALLERRHYWPDEPESPSPRSHVVKVLLDAVAWAVLRREWYGEQVDGDALGARVTWPAPLQALGLASEPRSAERIEVSLEAVRQELPSIDRAELPVSDTASEPFFEGLCRALRRTVFSDLARTRATLERIEYWEYGKSPGLAACASLRFQDYIVKGDDGVPVDIDDTVRDVSCHVIAEVELRCLAEPMRNTASAALAGSWRPRDWRWAAHYGVRTLDLTVLQTVALSQTRKRETYEDGQDLRDALYVIEARALRGSEFDSPRQRTREGTTDLQRQLYNGRLDDETRHRTAASPSLLTTEASITGLAEYLRRQHSPCERAHTERSLCSLVERGIITPEAAAERLAEETETPTGKRPKAAPRKPARRKTTTKKTAKRKRKRP